ncbi:hypothetical protein [Fusobacterium sp. PH5-44]|uniref:hypothetical protein n=1 Tax=unclassified Fusobacterium TaxID=2648384 RepID=UPI003D1E7E2C
MDVKKRLNKVYRNNINNDPNKSIKFQFRFKDTNISIYYDSFDEKIPVIFMILEYKKDIYLKNFNINNLEANNFSTKNIPANILNDLIVRDSLEEFTDILNKVLSVSDEFSICDYSKDELYQLYFNNKTLESDDIRAIKPFLFGIRRRTMQESHLESLYDALSIDIKNLKFLQSREYTIITTKDPVKRKNYSEEIKKIVI